MAPLADRRDTEHVVKRVARLFDGGPAAAAKPEQWLQLLPGDGVFPLVLECHSCHREVLRDLDNGDLYLDRPLARSHGEVGGRALAGAVAACVIRRGGSIVIVTVQDALRLQNPPKVNLRRSIEAQHPMQCL